jgi:hypothetical protein
MASLSSGASIRRLVRMMASPDVPKSSLTTGPTLAATRSLLRRDVVDRAEELSGRGKTVTRHAQPGDTEIGQVQVLGAASSSHSISTFSGFTSRCTSPWRWAASSAAAA